MPGRDLVQHRIAGVTNPATIVGSDTFFGLSRFTRYQPAPFVGRKRVWELKRAQWIVDTGIHDNTIAGGVQREHKFACFLVETNFQPSGSRLWSSPPASNAIYNLFNAEKAGVRILDQFGITTDSQREVAGPGTGGYGLGFAWSSKPTQTNTFPDGVFVVPERLYVKFVFDNRGNEDQGFAEVSGYCVLDFIERWFLTSEYLRLAGISRFGRFFTTIIA